MSNRNINIKIDGSGCFWWILGFLIFSLIFGGIKIVINTKGNSEKETNGLEKSRTETNGNQI